MTEHFSHVTQAHLVDQQEAFITQESSPGAAGYGLTFGQDGNFPFSYDAGTDTYYAYRWDFDDLGKGLRRPLTREEVQTLTGLYVTSHPFFWNSPWLYCEARLTKLYFKKPMTLMVNNCHRLTEETWSGNSSDPAHFVMNETCKKMVAYGYKGFYSNMKGSSPDLLILDPREFVTGAVWKNFEKNELNEFAEVSKTVTGLAALMESMFDSPRYDKHINSLR